MIVLGLHFGHDAACAVIGDGKILSVIVRERLRGAKHALGLNLDIVETACQEADVEVREIDFCAITSSQKMGIIAWGGLEVSLEDHPGHAAP